MADAGRLVDQYRSVLHKKLELRSSLLLRLRLGLLLYSHHPPDALDRQVHLLLGVVVIKLTQVGDQRSGQWKLLDVVDANYLSDAEATEVLK